MSKLMIFAFFMAAVAASAESNLHLQFTSVSQTHPPFKSPYEGQNPVSQQVTGNSLSGERETQTSVTMTIYGGLSPWKGAELYVDPELAGGAGISHTLGVAGYPNGEIYRVDDASPKWNLSRVYLKQMFGFGDATEEFLDDKNQLHARVPIERLTVVLGKYSLNDFFDNNQYSHDPRTQFLNWAFMDNGAWDYAADTRGYTWGLYLEFNQPRWAVRWASVMVPLRANQLEMDSDFPAHRGDNLEFEYRYSLLEKKGVARLMAYHNVANMGKYRQAIDNGEDLTLTRNPRSKYGFGINLEQELTPALGAFSRLGWNDGHSETWAFTEIDRTASLGVNWRGTSWNRKEDVAGLAVVVNWLASDHRDYLANGGYGFIIGDGRLSYNPEEIAEVFYLYRVINGLDATGDYQFIQNPAYNSDRGPVSVFSLRLHYEI